MVGVIRPTDSDAELAVKRIYNNQGIQALRWDSRHGARS